eukprot:3825273-Amphidinium_carterae.1
MNNQEGLIWGSVWVWGLGSIGMGAYCSQVSAGFLVEESIAIGISVQEGVSQEQQELFVFALSFPLLQLLPVEAAPSRAPPSSTTGNTTKKAILQTCTIQNRRLLCVQKVLLK